MSLRINLYGKWTKRFLCASLGLFLHGYAQAQVVETTTGGKVIATSGKAVTVGPPSRVSLIATATMLSNTLNTTASKACMTRKAHYNRSQSGRFQLIYGNWYDNATQANNIGMELGVGNPIAVQSWIEYPVGTFTQVLFGGLSTATIADATNQSSDFLSVSVPNGALFYTWTHVVGSGGNNYPFYTTTITNNPLLTTSPISEAANCGTSGVPSSPGAITDNDSGRQGYWEEAILGDTNQPTFVLVGDSRTSGVNDIEDRTFDLGNLARSIGPTNAYVNMGVSGDRMAAYFYSHSLRDGLIMLANPSAIIDELGTNEYDQQLVTTNAQWENISQNLMAHMVNTFPTIPVFRSTMEPWTTSTDSFATPLPVNWGITCLNQTGTSFNAAQTTENDHIRANSFDSIPFVELADPVTTARDSGCWKANGLSSFYTNGGHETLAGNVLIENAKTVNPRSISSTVPVTYPYPSLPMSGATPTFVSGPFTGTQGASLTTSQSLNSLFGVNGLPVSTIECWANPTSLPSVVTSTIFSGPETLKINATTGLLTVTSNDGTPHNSTTAVNLGSWQHLAIVTQPTPGTSTTETLYFNGVNILQFSRSITSVQWVNFKGVILGGGTVGYVGAIAECATWNFAKYTGNFTPPTSPYAGNETGLIALWHLNGNLTGIRGPAGL